MNILLILNWILNWMVFKHYSTFDWIIKIHRTPLTPSVFDGEFVNSIHPMREILRVKFLISLIITLSCTVWCVFKVFWFGIGSIGQLNACGSDRAEILFMNPFHLFPTFPFLSLNFKSKSSILELVELVNSIHIWERQGREIVNEPHSPKPNFSIYIFKL